jgi:hypothetical protein
MLISPLRLLSECVFLLEPLRIQELHRCLASLSLGTSFRRLSLPEQQMLVVIDLDDAVKYVEARRLPRQLHRTISYMDASLFTKPSMAFASASGSLPIDSLDTLVSPLTGSVPISTPGALDSHASDPGATGSWDVEAVVASFDGASSTAHDAAALEAPLAAVAMECVICCSRHGFNGQKCPYCANCCSGPRCSVKTHRQKQRRL